MGCYHIRPSPRFLLSRTTNFLTSLQLSISRAFPNLITSSLRGGDGVVGGGGLREVSEVAVFNTYESCKLTQPGPLMAVYLCLHFHASLVL